VVGATVEEMRQGLREHGSGKKSRAVAASAGAVGRPKIGFMFTGQGSQYVGMGRGLYERGGEFRAAVEECDRLLKGQWKESLAELLYGAGASEEKLRRTQNTQVAIFAWNMVCIESGRGWG